MLLLIVTTSTKPLAMASVKALHMSDDATLRTISLPIPALRAKDAQFFGCVAAPSASPSNERGRRAHSARDAYRANVLMTMENIVTANDLLPRSRKEADPHAWFAAYTKRLERALEESEQRAVPVSACLGIAFQDGGRRAISVATFGALAVTLLARNDRGAVTIATIAAAQETRVPLVFPHAMDGHLGPHDALLIGPEALHHALDVAILRRAGAMRTPGETIAVLERALHSAPSDANGLIICGSSITTARQSHASMESFLSTAQSTEAFLTPKLGPVLQRYFAQVRRTGALLKAARPSRRARRQPHRRTTAHSRARILSAAVQTIRLAFHTLGIFVRSAGAMLLDALRLLAIGIVRALHTARRVHAHLAKAKRDATAARTPTPADQPPTTMRPRDVRAALRNVCKQIPRTVRLPVAAVIAYASLRNRIRALPKQSQRLLLLAGAFALLFVVSTTALWRRQVSDANVASYNGIIASIEELRSVGEARLLFGDRIASQAAFGEATALVATLPRTTRARRDRAELLEHELAASLDRARLLTHIERPLRVAQTSESIPFLAIGPTAMIGTQLAVFDSALTQVARVDPRRGAVVVSALVPPPPLAAPVHITALDDRSLILVDERVRAVLVDSLTGATSAITIEQPPPTIRSVTVFNARLYLLHDDGRITRHYRTAAGFARGELWLPPNQIENGAVIVVNGALYASTDTGSVERYVTGRASNIALLDTVAPPIERATLLAALPNADTLAIGVPDDGRVIVVSDAGRLLGQVQSDAFRDMSAIAMDPSGDSLYVITTHAVYVIVPPV